MRFRQEQYNICWSYNLAVTAHVRHAETNYDELLSNMFERSEARMMVRDAVAEILEMWESEESGVTS